MSTLWRTAVEQGTEERLPFKIEHEMTHGGQPGYLYAARVQREHHEHPLVKEHGTLMGYVHAEEKPDPEDPGGYRTHVHMIEVNPGYQRQGVGRALLEHAIKHSDTGDVSHGGFTQEGSDLWKAVTGEHVWPSEWANRNNNRAWRYA